MSVITVKSAATAAAVVLAIVVSATLTGCGRLTAGPSDVAPSPTQSQTVDQAPTADLAGLDAELDDVDSLLDDSLSDLDAAAESEGKEGD